MAFEDLISKLIAQTGKWGVIKYLDQNGPPSYDDVLHDGLVQSGKTVGSTLGGAAGWVGGQAIGGTPGAVTGAVTLGSLGHLAGGWAGHTAYLQGPVIRDIIAHPENWTVDAAGAIVPVLPQPSESTNRSNDRGAQSALGFRAAASAAPLGYPPRAFESGTLPFPFAMGSASGGLPGFLAKIGIVDPHGPDSLALGGLPGLIQESLRISSPQSD